MNKRRRVYEGKAKVLYEGPEPGTLIQHFKDDATAFNNQKHAMIEGKGVLNNRISEYIFLRLAEIGVPTHFLRSLNMREQLIRQVEIIPIEVVVRNIAAGSLAQRLGLEEGKPLPRQIVERVDLFIEMLDLADEFCRAERLLSVARTPEERAFQTWFLREFVRQAGGEEPRSWAAVQSGDRESSHS